MNQKYYTKKEVADMLSVTIRTVDNYKNEGRLKYTYLSKNGDKTPRITQKDFDAFKASLEMRV
jgi:predicted site-specific integrase-resolvase